MLLDNTIQATGFFHGHHKEIRSILSDVTLKNFTNIEDDEKRISFIENVPEIKSFNDGLQTLDADPRSCSTSGKKDVVKGRMMKEEGNKCVQKGDWKQALFYYTKSILLMPYENESELSVLFANRSAALYHLQEYEACLSDIHTALTLNYPNELKYKVLDRKARCYLALKWNTDAISAFKETIVSLDSAKLAGDKRHKMQTDAQVMIEILNKSFQILNSKNKQLNEAMVQSGAAQRKHAITLPQVSGKSDRVYVSASEALSIQRNDTEGRFACSTKDVSAGEIVVVERPHCSVLLAEYATTHCFHCFKRCPYPLPCFTCANVIFCSVECRQDAYSSYHKTECSILRIIWDSGCSVTCHMALRIILQKPLSYFKNLMTKLKEPISGKYLYDDYRCVYNLVGHENLRSKADLFQRTHMAVFLLSLLKKTDYFNVNVNGNAGVNSNDQSSNDNGNSSNGNGDSVNLNRDALNGNGDSLNSNGDSSNGNGDSVNGNGDSSIGNGDSSNSNGDSSNSNGHSSNEQNGNKQNMDFEWSAYVGSLILKNLQVLQFNAHEIFELFCEKSLTKSKALVRKDQGKSVFLGGGLYPTLALFNHSCEPGVTRYFQGTSVIVQMVKNVKKGQQICENYGPLFTRKAFEQRQTELKDQYWFTCHCIACEQKWPKFDEMDETYMRFKCDSGVPCSNIIPVPINCNEFMIKCGLCQRHTNIMKGLKALQDTAVAQKAGTQHMEKAEYGKALVRFVEELKLYDETLAPPFKDYHLCQQNIRRCLLTFGNVNVEV